MSGVERSVVRRCGVRGAVLVDPGDPRPPLDGDVGRLEAEVLDQDRPGWMFLCPGRGMFLRPGGGHNQQRANHNQSRHRHQQDDAPHKRNLLLLLTPHSGNLCITVVCKKFCEEAGTLMDVGPGLCALWANFACEEFSEIQQEFIGNSSSPAVID